MWYFIRARWFNQNKVSEVGWRDDFDSFMWQLALLKDGEIEGYFVRKEHPNTLQNYRENR